MTTQILPASELRSKMAHILANLHREGSACFVTKNGKAVAALLPIELYDELISALEDRLDEADVNLAAQVNEARREYRAGKAVSLTKLKRLLGP